jgi:hypothetical protein
LKVVHFPSTTTVRIPQNENADLKKAIPNRAGYRWVQARAEHFNWSYKNKYKEQMKMIIRWWNIGNDERCIACTKSADTKESRTFILGSNWMILIRLWLRTKNPLLIFPAAFKTILISKRIDNATKILGIMKANNIYSNSTSELITSLNEKIGFDGQMRKANGACFIVLRDSSNFRIK